MVSACKKPESCKVVLVEDDALLRTVMGVQLREAKIDFCTASEGIEALTLILSHRPSVLILDLTMPGMDGFEIVKALHADASFLNSSSMSVIIYSSQDLTQSERQSLSLLGKTVFYTKSVNDRNMGEVVNQLLSVG